MDLDEEEIQEMLLDDEQEANNLKLTQYVYNLGMDTYLRQWSNGKWLDPVKIHNFD